MNKVFLSGRLTSDPEVRYTQNTNQAITIFSLAVKKGKDTMFINNITAWNKTGEFISKYVKKGTLINLIGELRVREYEKDNKKYHITEVVANEVEFGENKKEEKEGTTQQEFTPVTDDLPF